MATYIPQYTGAVPNRAADTPQEFANNVYSYQVYLDSAIPAMNDGIREVDLKWNEVKNQAVSGGYSQAYIDAHFAHAIAGKTITVSTSQEFINAMNSINRKKFTGPVIIELTDGVYNFTATQYYRALGEWGNWLIIRSQSGIKANVVLQYTGVGVMFNFDSNCVVIFQNLTVDGLDNTQNREFIQLYRGSKLVSWNTGCDIKNFMYGVSVLSQAFCLIDNWNFIETRFPVRAGANSIAWATYLTASVTPNDALTSAGAETWDNSFLDCSNSSFTGFQTGVYAHDHSRIYGTNLNISNFKDNGILAYLHGEFTGTATIDGMNGTVVRGNLGLHANGSSFLECIGASISNCQTALAAGSGSVLRSWDSSGTNITTRCVNANGHSTVQADRFNCISGQAVASAYDGSVAFTIGSNLTVDTGNLNTWTINGVVRQ